MSVDPQTMLQKEDEIPRLGMESEGQRDWNPWMAAPSTESRDRIGTPLMKRRFKMMEELGILLVHAVGEGSVMGSHGSPAVSPTRGGRPPLLEKCMAAARGGVMTRSAGAAPSRPAPRIVAAVVAAGDPEEQFTGDLRSSLADRVHMPTNLGVQKDKNEWEQGMTAQQGQPRLGAASHARPSRWGRSATGPHLME